MNTTVGCTKWLVIFTVFLGYSSVIAGDNGSLKEIERQYNEGVELMEDGDYKGAKEAFTEVVNRPVEDSDRESEVRVSSWNNLGSMALEEGNLEDAEKALEKAVELDPEHAVAHNNLGGLRLRQGRYKDAVDAYDKAIRSNPQYVEAINNLSELLITVREYERAHKLLLTAFKMEIANERCMDLLARTYAETNTEGSSKDIIKLWLREVGPDPDDMAEVGFKYLVLGQPEYAQIALDIIRDENPEWDGGGILEGRIAAAEGNWEEAEEKISAGLAKNPEDPSARNDLVTVLLRSDKIEEALKVAEEGTEHNSEQVQAVSWYLKGLVEEEKGDISSAESAYEKTIEIEPEHTQALLNLGNIKADKEQAEEAVELLERALRTDPYNQKVKYNLGRILTITQMEYKRGVRLLQAVAKGRGEAAQKAREFINKAYEGARQIEAREESGLQIEKSVLAKKGGGSWQPAEDAAFQKGDVVGLIFLNVRGFEKGDDGFNRMDLDVEVKGPDGDIILSENDVLGEKGKIKMEDNTAKSPLGSFSSTPEMESGEYTIKLTVKDKVGGGSASESKSFTLE